MNFMPSQKKCCIYFVSVRACVRVFAMFCHQTRPNGNIIHCDAQCGEQFIELLVVLPHFFLVHFVFQPLNFRSEQKKRSANMRQQSTTTTTTTTTIKTDD